MDNNGFLPVMVKVGILHIYMDVHTACMSIHACIGVLTVIYTALMSIHACIGVQQICYSDSN